MGQRANYIIIDGSSSNIRYTHWRANRITADLYLGEKAFMRYVNDCKPVDELLHEPWVEGCVIIDQNKKQLSFWSHEIHYNPVIIEFYLTKLQEQWPGWTIKLLRNRMYDVEKILNIDYISKQDPAELNIRSIETFIEDKVDEWDTALVVIKDETGIFITKTGNITTESIVCCGPQAIDILRSKVVADFPSDEDDFPMGTIVIDTSGKKILINESNYGLWEQTHHLWDGYTFLMGDYSGGELLRMAGIEINLETPSQEELRQQFDDTVKQGNDFDPFEMEEKLKKEHQGIQFNPDFFDTVKPRQTWVEKIVSRLRKFIGKR